MIASQRMDKTQRDELIRLITSPPRGSKIAAAKDFGIDLTLLVRRLELTPAERLQELAADAGLCPRIASRQEDFGP